MNTPNNLEWLDKIGELLVDNMVCMDDINHNIEVPLSVLEEAKQTIATKLLEAEQKGYGALYQFLISRLDVKTGRISLSSKQLANFHAEYIATLTNDKEQE